MCHPFEGKKAAFRGSGPRFRGMGWVFLRDANVKWRIFARAGRRRRDSGCSDSNLIGGPGSAGAEPALGALTSRCRRTIKSRPRDCGLEPAAIDADGLPGLGAPLV